MKLRNKKTGKIWDIPHYKEITMDDGKNKYTYKSLAEVNENWEDYKPKEPLIKGEDSRNILREWAELFGAERFRVEHLCKYGRTIITSTDLTTKPAIELPGYIGENSEIYTIEELLGSEEC